LTNENTDHDSSSTDTDIGSARAPLDMADSPVVIGIGASGAALESVSTLLSRLSPAPDQAIVVVLQHREATEDEALRQALAVHHEHFEPIENGTQVQGGRIYVAPQNVIVTLADGHFQSRPAQQEPGSRGTIDSFFVSLAQERGERALAIMLAGTAGDGTLGFAAIKEHGGLTVAEETSHETAAELAASSFPVALADLLLPLGEIPDHVISSARQLVRRSARESLDVRLSTCLTRCGRSRPPCATGPATISTATSRKPSCAACSAG